MFCAIKGAETITDEESHVIVFADASATPSTRRAPTAYAAESMAKYSAGLELQCLRLLWLRVHQRPAVAQQHPFQRVFAAGARGGAGVRGDGGRDCSSRLFAGGGRDEHRSKRSCGHFFQPDKANRPIANTARAFQGWQPK